MSNGIGFLMKKNKIDVIEGTAKVKKGKKIAVTDSKDKTTEYQADHIIIATGARSRELPNLKQDGKNIIGYREALTLKELPKRMLVVGSGAIGSEFAHFYNTMGAEVTIVEYQPRLVPVEDEEISKAFEKSTKKAGIKVMTNASVESVDTSRDVLKAKVKTKKGEKTIETDVVLSAVGIQSNIENNGLEEVGIKVDNNKIQVNEWYQTNVPGYYAIGDVVPGQALAHVASAEGILCVEKIKGLNPEALDYENVPGCTYTTPEIASVGMTEKQAKEAGYDIKVGKFPFSANGK